MERSIVGRSSLSHTGEWGGLDPGRPPRNLYIYMYIHVYTDWPCTCLVQAVAGELHGVGNGAGQMDIAKEPGSKVHRKGQGRGNRQHGYLLAGWPG